MLYWIFDSDWATPHSRPRKLISTLRWTTETTSVWETDQETFKYYTNFIWTLSVCLQGDQVHTALKHLDLKNTYVCMLSIDYNPAFNTSLIPNMESAYKKRERRTTVLGLQHNFGCSTTHLLLQETDGRKPMCNKSSVVLVQLHKGRTGSRPEGHYNCWTKLPDISSTSAVCSDQSVSSLTLTPFQLHLSGKWFKTSIKTRVLISSWTLPARRYRHCLNFSVYLLFILIFPSYGGAALSHCSSIFFHLSGARLQKRQMTWHTTSAQYNFSLVLVFLSFISFFPHFSFKFNV